jgi:hypothetical protein
MENPGGVLQFCQLFALFDYIPENGKQKSLPQVKTAFTRTL